MHRQHKLALEQWARKPNEISYVSSRGIGERTFKHAIEQGWIERLHTEKLRIRWYEGYYHLTDAGRAVVSQF